MFIGVAPWRRCTVLHLIYVKAAAPVFSKASVMDRISQLRRLGVFDAELPRYTSYPPAPQFANDVSPARYAAWLAQIPAGTPISFYIHVPFCKRLCWFCACRTQGLRAASEVSGYVDTLIQEIATLRAALPQDVQAVRVFWGGGTPTILPPEDISRLAAALAEAFGQTATTEITVEVDPNEIDEARIDALAEMGMTRASLGVQDFDPEVQKIIGRELSFERTRNTVEALRARGVSGLDADLLYGLPRQNRARIAQSAQMLMSLHPDRIALHGYAHVPAVARRQALIPTDDLATPEGRLELFDATARIIRSDGFEAIGVDQFARPEDPLAIAAKTGHLRRGFQGYRDDAGGVLLGIGASAISSLPQGYAQNAPSTAAYMSVVRAGALATTRGHTFTKDDTLRGRMIEMLLCEFQIDAMRVGTNSQVALVNTMLDRVVHRFGDQVVRTPSGIALKPDAKVFARVIARDLDAYATLAKGPTAAA